MKLNLDEALSALKSAGESGSVDRFLSLSESIKRAGWYSRQYRDEVKEFFDSKIYKNTHEEAYLNGMINAHRWAIESIEENNFKDAVYFLKVFRNYSHMSGITIDLADMILVANAFSQQEVSYEDREYFKSELLRL